MYSGVNRVDQSAAVRCASENMDAMDLRGSRWVCTTTASGYTSSSASSANRWLGFLRTQRRPGSSAPISWRLRLCRRYAGTQSTPSSQREYPSSLARHS